MQKWSLEIARLATTKPWHKKAAAFCFKKNALEGLHVDNAWVSRPSGTKLTETLLERGKQGTALGQPGKQLSQLLE